MVSKATQTFNTSTWILVRISVFPLLKTDVLLMKRFVTDSKRVKAAMALGLYVTRASSRPLSSSCDGLATSDNSEGSFNSRVKKDVVQLT